MPRSSTSPRCSPTWCRSWCCWSCWRSGRGACSAAANNSTGSEMSQQSYAQELALFGTPRARVRLAVSVVALGVLPFVTTPLLLDLANQVLLACIGALALMLLTGFAGLISLGTAGLLAAGAYAVGVLVREVAAPFWVTLPAAGVLGAFLGLVFGLPSLRL